MRTLFSYSLLTVVIFSLLATTPLAVAQQRNNMRNARYGEIIVVTGGPLEFTGHVYNTLGLNDCPEAQWKKLDPTTLKKTWKADAVILNGPRYFMMDSCSINHHGDAVSFGDLQARHLADVKIPLINFLHLSARPYTESVVKRTTTYLFKQGLPIYELISPEGKTYVMQSYSRIIDPKLQESDLASLKNRLSLPKGWRYQVSKPDTDLVMKTSGTAYVLQDSLKNSYQRK